MDLSSSVRDVKGVGDELAKKLAILSIHSVGELIDYLPRRYEDYSDILAIRDTKPGPVTIRAVIKQVSGRYVRRGMHLTEARSDESGSMRLVWFNQPYRANGLKTGAEYYFSGLYELSHQHMQMTSPSAELVSDFRSIPPASYQSTGRQRVLRANRSAELIGSCRAANTNVAGNSASLAHQPSKNSSAGQTQCWRCTSPKAVKS